MNDASRAPESGRVTIKDVARHAGVSTAAASKVLRSAYGVSPAMRERVEAAIAELGYRPLASARAMRGRTYTVGVLLSDLFNPFFALLTEGMGGPIADARYQLLAGPAGATAGSQTATIEAMLDHRMDGLVLIAPLLEAEQLERIGATTPLVVVGRHGEARHYDTVASDDIRGSTLIVDHLVGLGHRRIAHVTHGTGPRADPLLPESMRLQGYREAMARHGLEPDVVAAAWSYEGGRAAGRRLLEQPRMPTAVHAGADVAAFGLLSALWDARVPVPGRVSVVGYDNSPTAALAPIALTSVDQSGVEMGHRAAELLIERIEGRSEPVAEVLQPELVVRATSTAPGDDA